tara:strand:- start:2069 stop:3007 length:939 start_codon:yes stop_codon:yes gene_type:complete
MTSSNKRSQKPIQSVFPEVDPSDWNCEKRSQRASLSFLDDILVSRGTRDDWRVLEALHYKNHGTLTPGSHYFKMTLHGDVIGVLMMASPKLLLKERHAMFPKLKPGRDSKLTNTMRMKWINANMSIVARCVVDTMFRGAGLAYRFTNLASRMEGKKFIEIQSSMSKYNLFAQKAGFKFCPPMRSNKYDVGIRFFRGMFDADPSDTEGLIQEIEALPEIERNKVIDEIRVFYRKHSMLENTGKALIETNGVAFGDSRVARLPLRELVYQLQQMVLASPLYGVYQNPDVGREFPNEVPLMWFDRQPTTQQLILE